MFALSFIVVTIYLIILVWFSNAIYYKNPNHKNKDFYHHISIIVAAKNEKKFDYLLLVILDNAYSLDMILELTWDDFFKHKRYNKRMNNYNISITKRLIGDVKVVYERS